MCLNVSLKQQQLPTNVLNDFQELWRHFQDILKFWDKFAFSRANIKKKLAHFLILLQR